MADVVEQEAAGAVGVLGGTLDESLLADECGGLVAQAARDADSLQFARRQFTVGFRVRARHDLGQLELARVEAEEGDELLVVLEVVQVHEAGPRGVCAVGDEDAAVLAAGELVEQPCVGGAKGETALLVGLLALFVVANEPEQLH